MKEEICPFCDFENGVESMYMGSQNGVDIEACVIPPSPISKRKNPDTPANLKVYTMSLKGSQEFEIPIKYCPICGRLLNLQ